MALTFGNGCCHLFHPLKIQKVDSLINKTKHKNVYSNKIIFNNIILSKYDGQEK